MSRLHEELAWLHAECRAVAEARKAARKVQRWERWRWLRELALIAFATVLGNLLFDGFFQ